MPKKNFQLKSTASAAKQEEAHHPIVPTPVQAGDEEEEVVSRARGSRPKFPRVIPVERIHPNPKQFRKTFNQAKLEEMADGFREHGWVGGGLPVRAHPTAQNEYQLVWGERRLRAAKLAGLVAIPCEVSAYTDDDMVELGLLENIQREDLTRLEEGMAYEEVLGLRDGDEQPKYSIRRLAQRIGKDKSYIEDRLQYARAPEAVQQLVIEKPDVAPRIVRELAHMEDESMRDALIAAVLRDDSDINVAGVMQVRKQLQSQFASIEPAEPVAVEEVVEKAEAVAGESQVEQEPPAARPVVSDIEVKRRMLEGKLASDSKRILSIIERWSSVDDELFSEDIRLSIHLEAANWLLAIAKVEQKWRKDE
jgi:ParB/RepB/Spo0J family partition protein